MLAAFLAITFSFLFRRKGVYSIHGPQTPGGGAKEDLSANISTPAEAARFFI
jgi:hypothetical protein